ncbi:ABC transporter permease [Tabrizicola sp.]|uniref:ABC transporter permease n=1 Tax=Tabrizicola sp. TaxID=2005166 RepID=UPI0025D70966|nr:ABC transporter permease subunit [Tabrizicola sp.]
MTATDDTAAWPRETAAAAPGTKGPRAGRSALAVQVVLWATVLVFCLVPLFLVLVISFGHKIEGAGWEWALTLENYQRFFVGANWPAESTSLYLGQLYWSMRYAVVAALLAVVTALPFTYLMTRQSRRAQAVWLVFLLATLSLSEVFIVMGWDIILSNNSGLPMLFAATGLTDWLKDTGWFDVLRDWGLANPRNVKFKPSEVATVLTLSYLVWPYAVILLYPALSRLDPSLAEAARTMGARPWTVARTVILPSVRLPLIGTTLLLFVFLLGAYVAITVFADPSQHTTAVSVYEHVRGSTLNAPFGAAQSVILLVTATAFLVLGQWLTRKSPRAA